MTARPLAPYPCLIPLSLLFQTPRLPLLFRDSSDSRAQFTLSSRSSRSATCFPPASLIGAPHGSARHPWPLYKKNDVARVKKRKKESSRAFAFRLDAANERLGTSKLGPAELKYAFLHGHSKKEYSIHSIDNRVRYESAYNEALIGLVQSSSPINPETIELHISVENFQYNFVEPLRSKMMPPEDPDARFRHFGTTSTPQEHAVLQSFK
ncbi:hypothetical protein DFJ77DRAFT_437919 [Powellomyces hirtus]|nr:hypothetical protein DFJ77DRAFT_437919 [Powellomyces hirtus]